MEAWSTRSHRFINMKAKAKNRVHQVSSQVELKHHHHDFNMTLNTTITTIIITTRTQRTTTTATAVNHHCHRIDSTMVRHRKRISRRLIIILIIWRTLTRCPMLTHIIYIHIILITNKRINWFHHNHLLHQIHHLLLHHPPSTQILHRHKVPRRRCSLAIITIIICCTILSIIPTTGIIQQHLLVTSPWTIWITSAIITIT